MFWIELISQKLIFYNLVKKIKKDLLDDFMNQYFDAKKKGISLNPILNSFVQTVKRYDINQDLIDAFISSMYKDLGEIK